MKWFQELVFKISTCLEVYILVKFSITAFQRDIFFSIVHLTVTHFWFLHHRIQFASQHVGRRDVFFLAHLYNFLNSCLLTSPSLHSVCNPTHSRERLVRSAYLQFHYLISFVSIMAGIWLRSNRVRRRETCPQLISAIAIEHIQE